MVELGWSKQRIEAIYSGELRMLMLFGTHAAKNQWLGRKRELLVATGATYYHNPPHFSWPNGAWLKLEVVETGAAEQLRGMTLTDYEMDETVAWRNHPKWRQLLESITKG